MYEKFNYYNNFIQINPGSLWIYWGQIAEANYV